MIFLSNPNAKVFQVFSLILYSVIALMWILVLLLDFTPGTFFAFILGAGGFGCIILLNLKLKQLIILGGQLNIQGIFKSNSVPLGEVDKIIPTLIAPPFYKIILKDGRLYYFSVNKELSIRLSLKLGNDLIVSGLNRLVVNSKSSS
jgi:hypothetical protein